MTDFIKFRCIEIFNSDTAYLFPKNFPQLINRKLSKERVHIFGKPILSSFFSRQFGSEPNAEDLLRSIQNAKYCACYQTERKKE